jgi:hypothetical protein
MERFRRVRDNATFLPKHTLKIPQTSDARHRLTGTDSTKLRSMVNPAS